MLGGIERPARLQHADQRGCGPLDRKAGRGQITQDLGGPGEEFGFESKGSGKPLEQGCPMEIKCELVCNLTLSGSHSFKK